MWDFRGKDKKSLSEAMKSHLDKPGEPDWIPPQPLRFELPKSELIGVEKRKEIKEMGYWDTHPLVDETKITIPPFIPEFLTVYGASVGNDGKPISWPMNPEYFATQPTAQWIASKFGDGQVYSQPFFESGPFSVSAPVNLVKLKDGRYTNAGILAAYYVRNPEDKFPGLAEKLIRAQLGI